MYASLFGAVIGIGVIAVVLVKAFRNKAEAVETTEAEPESELALCDPLREIVTKFLAYSVMEQEMIFQLAYAICGFGPGGKLIKLRAQAHDPETWSWLYRSLVPTAGLPDQSDVRRFEELTGRCVDDVLQNKLAILCLVHFGGFLARINEELAGHKLRHTVPGLAETINAHNTFGCLRELTAGYFSVPEDDRTFFDASYPDKVLLPLPVRASDKTDPGTGQLFMTPKERLGLAICHDFKEDDLRRSLVVFSFAICGFGPQGEQVKAVAQRLNYPHTSWEDYYTYVGCIIGTSRTPEIFVANTWYLGEVGFYAAYLTMVYAALSDEMRSKLLGQGYLEFEDTLRRVVSLSAEFFPQQLAAH